MPNARQETGLSLSRPQSESRAHHGSDEGAVLYKGNCHCGRNRFEVKLPEITSGTGCNCSLCHKSGYFWAFPDADNVKYTRGDVDTLGTFETETLRHEYCTFCGTGLYGTHKVGQLKDRPGVNIRAIIGVNPFKLDAFIEDTAATFIETPVELPPSLQNDLRPVELDNENIKIYTGSCQCGAVAFAVKTPPLGAVEIKEDNCSICVRRAATSIYPDKDQVTLLGEENTTTYAFGRKFNQAPFCRTCGVACYGVPVGPPQALVDKLPEEKRKFVEMQRRIRPLYIRAMNGVEWDKIKIVRSDEGTDGYDISDESA